MRLSMGTTLHLHLSDVDYEKWSAETLDAVHFRSDLRQMARSFARAARGSIVIIESPAGIPLYPSFLAQPPADLGAAILAVLTEDDADFRESVPAPASSVLELPPDTERSPHSL